ncbi:MAG: glycosyl transferase [Candidatus Goldiibacteriota bacterium HGW-Goldbacteria-1]|jgi:glycosyltransferase involved in cell wall biosynthesis|nr:MAG: glycosyl transferase [Candidatus Goldiibacteriota bacterium HGW-Goldbacteria-1]
MSQDLVKEILLSVIIPVYNEERTLEELVDRVMNVQLEGVTKQVVIVDDKSTDATHSILEKINLKYPQIEIIYKEKNEGKGAALKTGFALAKGDYTIIQDADLEYDPEDYKVIIDSFKHKEVDVVYGSRFLGRHRAFLFMNLIANKILNLVTNILYNTTLTDMETCYKMFKTELIQSLEIKSKGFEIEPEITAKMLKKQARIYEVPISFYGRSYNEGKKIKAIDGFKAIWALIKYRFVD